MRYCSLSYSRSDNLGDEIQSLAAEQYLPRIDGFVDRDLGLDAVSEPTFIFFNGWFKEGPHHWRENATEHWPPSENVHPVFIGFHLAHPELLDDRFLAYYRKWAPIGCRDRGTMEMLQEKGVDAYYSRCLTLTFPKRGKEPPSGRVYMVEGTQRIDKDMIPKQLVQEAVYKNHYIRYTVAGSNKNNELKREVARQLLEEYRSNARLVITNLIHCAMPCLAMQIPVVFIMPHDPTGRRLGPIRDLLPLYKPGDEIDWNPKAPDISTIAEEIRAKARSLVINEMVAGGEPSVVHS